MGVQLSDALSERGHVKTTEASAVLLNTMAFSILAELATEPAAGTPALLIAFRHEPILPRAGLIGDLSDRKIHAPCSQEIAGVGFE